MSPLRPILWVLIVSVGCGGATGGADASQSSDAAGVMDAGDGGGFLDTSPAEAGMDTGSPDALVDAPVDASRDGVDPVIRELFDAQEEAALRQCECHFAELGFASLEACQAEAGERPIVVACWSVAFQGQRAAFESYATCEAAADRELAQCLVAADCEDAPESACRDARPTCELPEAEAEDAFAQAVIACLIGEPSGCPDEPTPRTGTGDAVFTASSGGKGDDTVGSCGGDGAPDVSFVWRAPEDASFQIDTVGSSFDTVLYVLDGDCAGSELACDDDGSAPQSSLTVPLARDQEIVIVVDGYSTASLGDVVVNIHAAP